MEEQLHFNSGPVRLEALLGYDEDLARPRARVLLCPPHPFLGGDMNNNVLEALATRLIESGYVVLRFNYRGIGGSETDRDLIADQQAFWENSSCPAYEADIFTDSLAAAHTLDSCVAAQTPLVIIGYSFGCLPAIRISCERPVERLALISPPLTKWALETDSLPDGIPKRFFYSTNDFACPVEAMESLVGAAPQPVSADRFDGADHFFIGQEAELAAAVCRFLEANHA